jgi:hypothetical protein
MDDSKKKPCPLELDCAKAKDPTVVSSSVYDDDLGALSDCSKCSSLAISDDEAKEGTATFDNFQRIDAEPPKVAPQSAAQLANVNANRTFDDWISLLPPGNSVVKKRLRVKWKGLERRRQAESSMAQSAFVALARVHNRRQLRRGQRVDVNLTVRTKRTRWSTKTHTNAWTVRGTTRLAFSCVGARAHRGAQPTCRACDAVALVSYACQSHELGISSFTIRSLRFGWRRALWAINTRELDATPVRVRFGRMLQSMLSDIARYWHRDKSKPVGEQWTCVTAAVLKSKGVKHVALQGIVELLGQAGKFAWAEQAIDSDSSEISVQRLPLRFPPVFLESTSGSCQLSATRHFAGVAFEDVIAMSSNVPLVALGIGTDGAYSCGRMKMAVMEQISAHNANSSAESGQGVVMLFSSPCCGHYIQNEIIHTGKSSELIGCLHATAWTASLADTQSSMADALPKIVYRDLAAGFYPACQPPPGAAEANRIVASWLIPRALQLQPHHLKVCELLDEWESLFNGPRQGQFASTMCM